MRVIQVGGTYVGAQKTIEGAIHKELISRGCDSAIFYAIGASDGDGVVCYERKISQIFRRIKLKFLGKNPRFARASTKRLIKLIKDFKPHIVNLHVIHHGYLDYPFLFKFLAKERISVVFTAHDMWQFTGGCYYYTRENCNGFQNGCKNCPACENRLDNPKSKTHEYFSLKKQMFSELADVRFVAVSQWVADEMKKSFLGEYPIKVIENGIQPIEFSYTDVEPRSQTTKILAVAAAWDERKGIKRIIETAKLLGNSYEFWLAGSASQEIMEKAPENIRFLGYISDKAKLYELYSKADLHISASFEETFGMTFVEAAFLGTRSIGYASTAVKSTLEGVNGIAVDQMTEAALAEAIKETAQAGKTKLSKEEIALITEKYSSASMAKKYCDLYSEMLI